MSHLAISASSDCHRSQMHQGASLILLTSLMRALTCTDSKSATQHGCVVCAVVETQAARGLWPYGYQKLANGDDGVGFCLVVAGGPRVAAAEVVGVVQDRTCFWAGDMFSSKLRICDSVPIQRSCKTPFGHVGECRVPRGRS